MKSNCLLQGKMAPACLPAQTQSMPNREHIVLIREGNVYISLKYEQPLPA